MFMFVIKFLIDVALAIIPGLALKGKKNLEIELEIAKKTVEFLSKDLTPETKANILDNAVQNLKAVKNFKKRISKKFDKARIRIFKKFF